ncbi:MAG TPA: hypothetical protein VL281_04915 [Mycobacteriales bacterium]|nr:hypothetical protein [Mycobacteriales bacterium]
MLGPTPGSRLRRAVKLGLATALVAAGVPLSAGIAQAGGSTSPCPTTPDKCYTFTISASPAPTPGQSSTYTGKLTNLSKGGTGVQLGAANVSWSPSDAFSSFTAGGVSPLGSETYVAPNQLQLRNLSVPPGKTATFTFQATSLQAETVTFTSAAKQSNNFSGTGNDLTYAGSTPSVDVSPFCSDGLVFDAYGCKGILKTQGGTVSTGSIDSNGHPSTVTASLTMPPVTPAPGSPTVQLMALRSYLSGDSCPVVVPCSLTVQLLNKLDIEYDTAHSATLAIHCAPLCGALTIWYQIDEAIGIPEVLPLCLPVIGALPSPLSGSTACYTNAADGIVVTGVNHNNDWKVAG